MSGHSKWSTIKRKKGVADAKRGAIFTRLSREIIVAAKQGGGDPDMNFKLRLAVQRAKAANMPNDNIDRAIAKATGGADADNLQEITFEGYGPGGTAFLVSALTDNRNRTVADVRHQFTRAGGSLGETGSVAWQFESKGSITVNVNGQDVDEIQLAAIEAGADDVQTDGDSVEILTALPDLEGVRQQLETGGFSIDNADLAMIPTVSVPLDDKAAQQVLRLVESLEDLEDVQRVYTNADISDEALAAYAED
jgi:YebC/PmpR family DNA-binding regulatory protein